MATIGRDFFKACTDDLDDPRFLALTMEQRGVLDSALKLQARMSSAPGTFLTPMGQPLSIDQIASFLHMWSDEGRGIVAATFEACAAADPPLLVCDKRSGAWMKPDWLDRHTFESQRAGLREANAKRKRDQRSREKAARKNARAASKVTPLRERNEADK